MPEIERPARFDDAVPWWQRSEPEAADRPDLSVVVPSRDRPDDVFRAIGSVFAERMARVEIILVDDGSEPPLAVPNDPSSGVRLVRHDRNRGPAAARNSGMREARGHFLTFLDSDDLLLPGTLQARLDFARVHQDLPLAIASSGFEDADRSGTPTRIRHPRRARTAADFASGCWFAPGSSIIVRHPHFVQAVGFQDETLRRLEDLDWFLRAGLKGATILPDGVVGARLKPGEGRGLEAVSAAVTRLQAKWEGVLPRPAWRRLEAYLALELAVAAWRAGRPFRALLAMSRSMLLQPRLRFHLSPGWRKETLRS